MLATIPNNYGNIMMKQPISPMKPRRGLRPNLIVFVCTLLFLVSSILFYAIDPTQRRLTSQISLVRRHGEGNIAFLIQAYSKTIQNLPGLLPVIWHEDNVYLFHIDSEVPEEERENFNKFVQGYNHTGNIHFMKPEPVTYLGYTTILNTFNALSLLNKISKDWDYFINLSGADYPLLRPEHIRSLLGTDEIRRMQPNFVQIGNGMNRTEEKMYRSRFRRLFVDTALWTGILDGKNKMGNENESQDCEGGCLWRTKEEKHPLHSSHLGQLPILKTEAWVILHRSFVKFVLDSDVSRRLMAISVNVVCPEEYFFGTLLRMSDFADTAVYHSFRSIFWRYKTEKSPRAPELDSGFANVGEELMRTNDLFARKFMKPHSDVKTYVNTHLLGMDQQGRRIKDDMKNVTRRFDRIRKRFPCIVKTRYAWSKFANEIDKCTEEQN